uniref:Uncharacterized protein n=1 Tax=Anguilla anguilla TaxID=7936 RepID=A0A0E9VHC7_ANGAN
MDPVDPLV